MVFGARRVYREIESRLGGHSIWSPVVVRWDYEPLRYGSWREREKKDNTISKQEKEMAKKDNTISKLYLSSSLIVLSFFAIF